MSEWPVALVNKDPENLFLVDDTLPELEKIKTYVKSKLPLQRLVYTKRLSWCARLVGKDQTLNHLIPLLPVIATDSEATIRQALGHELGELALILTAEPPGPVLAPAPVPAPEPVAPPPAEEPSKAPVESDLKADVLHPLLPGVLKPTAAAPSDPEPTSKRRKSYEEDDEEEEPGYLSVMVEIAPRIQQLLLDTVPVVREAAAKSLCQVAKVLRGDDVGKIVLTMVLCLAHDEAQEDRRVIALQLMSELAPHLDPALCVNFVALEAAAFADDRSAKVKKATAESFGVICKAVGPTTTVNKLLSWYLKLCDDPRPEIRLACVGSLVTVTSVVPEDVRAAKLVPLYKKFVADRSKWVKERAQKAAGYFIHALGTQLATQGVVDFYTGLPYLPYSNIEDSPAFHCAFTFPAVLQTVTAARWPELVRCFEALCKDNRILIRSRVAQWLGVVGSLLPPSHRDAHIAPVAMAFLKAHVEVRTALVGNLTVLLTCLSLSHRVSLIEEVGRQCEARDSQWRFRESVAGQLGECCGCFPVSIGLPLAELGMALCSDPVAAVRVRAAAAVAMLLGWAERDEYEDPYDTVVPLAPEVTAEQLEAEAEAAPAHPSSELLPAEFLPGAMDLSMKNISNNSADLDAAMEDRSRVKSTVDTNNIAAKIDSLEGLMGDQPMSLLGDQPAGGPLSPLTAAIRRKSDEERVGSSRSERKNGTGLDGLDPTELDASWALQEDKPDPSTSTANSTGTTSSSLEAVGSSGTGLGSGSNASSINPSNSNSNSKSDSDFSKSPFSKPLLGQLFNGVFTLAGSSTYTDRQLFIRICTAAMTTVSLELYREWLLPRALALCGDRVSNVRVLLAKLCVALVAMESWEDDENLRSALTTLQGDKNRDVAFFSRTAKGQAQGASSPADLDDIVRYTDSLQVGSSSSSSSQSVKGAENTKSKLGSVPSAKASPMTTFFFSNSLPRSGSSLPSQSASASPSPSQSPKSPASSKVQSVPQSKSVTQSSQQPSKPQSGLSKVTSPPASSKTSATGTGSRPAPAVVTSTAIPASALAPAVTTPKQKVLLEELLAPVEGSNRKNRLPSLGANVFD